MLPDITQTFVEKPGALKSGARKDRENGLQCDDDDDDDDDDVLEQRKLQFLDSLPKSIDDICKIEVSTKGQASNDLWKENRSNMLTASNFGTVCKLRKKDC
ncbi:unnamed protein product [Psylliodes chrysocephalus]|uniref:Uncharacterized protein n=1 Tax=Psylliodes chrysocephalus TaxID=3402493 RepID=A0A9P0D917_9CUCU|nr:unnamed protein product [Psylliodes chrysocephala]